MSDVEDKMERGTTAEALPDGPPMSVEEPTLVHRIAVVPAGVRAPVAEMLGTMLLVLLGTTSNAQALLAKPDDSNFLSLSIGWGVGLLLGVLVSGDISGAHLNPAMTLVMATLRGFPWSQVPGYILSQLFGAVIGGVISQSNYYELVNQVEGGAGLRTLGNANSTALIFITGPADWMSYTGAFFDEVLGTALLCAAVLAMGEGNRAGLATHVKAVILMWAFIGVSGGIGIQTSFGLNPARDLGPRIAAAMFGYPRTIWTSANCYFLWGAILGPIAGAFVGAAIHDIAVGRGIPLPSWRRRLVRD